MAAQFRGAIRGGVPILGNAHPESGSEALRHLSTACEVRPISRMGQTGRRNSGQAPGGSGRTSSGLLETSRVQGGGRSRPHPIVFDGPRLQRNGQPQDYSRDARRLIRVLCQVSNTTDSVKPIVCHPSAGSHYCLVQNATSWLAGILPVVIPQLWEGIRTKPTGWSPEHILYLSSHSSVHLQMTYKPEHPEKFKGRVVYDPMTHGGGFSGDDACRRQSRPVSSRIPLSTKSRTEIGRTRVPSMEHHSAAELNNGSRMSCLSQVMPRNGRNLLHVGFCLSTADLVAVTPITTHAHTPNLRLAQPNRRSLALGNSSVENT